MLGWAWRASSKLLFFSTRTSSSSAISARQATARVHRIQNFIVVTVELPFYPGTGGGGSHGPPRTGELTRFLNNRFICPSCSGRLGRIAGEFCVYPLLTWQCTEKPEGSAAVRMRIYEAESCSCWNVTGPQRAPPGSETRASKKAQQICIKSLKNTK